MNFIMAIPYQSEQKDQWRCQINGMKRNGPQTLIVLAIPIFVIYVLPTLQGKPVSISALGTLGICAAFVGMIFLMMALAIASMYPPGKPIRVCAIGLTREGFLDMMPTSSAFIPWSRVKGIEAHGPDVYFRTIGGGCHCPCVMRDNPEYGRLLLQTATELWKGLPISSPNLPLVLPVGYGMVPPPAWPAQYPTQPPGVWPPPPSGQWPPQQQWPKQQQQWPQQQQPQNEPYDPNGS